jgi:hypothetical protein
MLSIITIGGSCKISQKLCQNKIVIFSITNSAEISSSHCICILLYLDCTSACMALRLPPPSSNCVSTCLPVYSSACQAAPSKIRLSARLIDCLTVCPSTLSFNGPHTDLTFLVFTYLPVCLLGCQSPLPVCLSF